MAFTVAEALKIDIFRKCRLLTGQAGLQNEIRWVNILEILDDLRHIEPGEFLITTAHGFNVESRAKQLDMVELFASRNLAAMAIQTGHYLQEIPPSFIRFSENYNIPLIEIPPEASFKSLTRALMNELMRRELLEADPAALPSGKSRLEKQIAGMKELWRKLVEEVNYEGLTIQLNKFGLKPGDPVLVMDFDIDSEEKSELANTSEQAAAQALGQLHVPFLIGLSDNFITLLVQSDQLKKQATATDTLIAEQILEVLQRHLPEYNVRIGLSNIHDNFGMIRQALDEAKKARQAAHLELLDHTNIASLRYMNLYRLIMDTENMEMLKSIYNKTARPLVEYDRRSKGSLLMTLQVYLQQQSIKKASEILFVHRHTMKYRLNQIENLTGFNPLLPGEALQLNIGLHIYYYMKALNLISG